MKTRNYLFIISALVLLNLSGIVTAQWTTPTILSQVNTPSEVSWAFSSADGLTLYFARGSTYQMYQATRPGSSDTFASIKQINEMTGGDNVQSMWMSPDNLHIYYSTTESGSVRRIKQNTRNNTSSRWFVPINLTELNNLGDAGNPTLSANERSIVFNILTVVDGKSYGALYCASRTSSNSAFTDIKAIRELNTADVRAQYLSSDGLTLYFSRNDNGTVRNYKSARSSISSAFGTAQQVTLWPDGYVLSSFSADGRTAYLIRNGNIYVSSSESIAVLKCNNNTGELSNIQNININELAIGNFYDLKLSNDDRFLYAPSFHTNEICLFERDTIVVSCKRYNY